VSRPAVKIPEFNPQDGTLAHDPFYFLQKLFVYFLQNLFRTFPAGYGMRWDPDTTTTELVISADKPQLSDVEVLPHVTCILGSGQWGNVGMDQLQALRSFDAQRTHTDLMSMTMSYHCQAKEDMDAQRIAWNTSFYTNVFRRLIHQAGSIHHLAPNHSISAVSGPTAFTGSKAENEIVSVVVTVPFYWQPQWRIKKPAELWKRMVVQLSVNETRPYPVPRQQIRPPTVGGRPVTTVPIEKAFVQVVTEYESD
jgi:hypothetical protein